MGVMLFSRLRRHPDLSHPGYFGAVLGFIVMFVGMIWANMRYPVKKGPSQG